MAVLSQNGKICEAFDPTEVDKDLNKIKIEKWYSLTKSQTRDNQFAVGSKVLALYYDDNEWTTEFYEATVRSLPNQNTPQQKTLYELDFGEGDHSHIPELKIVPFFT